MFSSGVSHFWLDIQWYLLRRWPRRAHRGTDGQRLSVRPGAAAGAPAGAGKSGMERRQPFADEVTRNWIAQQVMMREAAHGLRGKPLYRQTTPQTTYGAGAGSAGDSRQSGRGSGAGWIQTRPGITTARQRLLLRLRWRGWRNSTVKTRWRSCCWKTGYSRTGNNADAVGARTAV